MPEYTPVEYDPFSKDEKTAETLTPVDYDPFMEPSKKDGEDRTWPQYAADVAENLPRGLAQGATFGLQDEISAALGAKAAQVLRGEDYNSAYDKQVAFQRAKMQEARQETPYTTGAAELGGVVGTSIIGGGFAPQIVKIAAAHPYLGSAGIGAVSGGIYGFGTGEGGIQERLNSAGWAGGAGLLAGPTGSFVGKKVVPWVGNAAVGLADRARKMFGFSSAAPSITAKMPLQDIIEQRAELPSTPLNAATSDAGYKAESLVANAIKRDFPNNFDEVMTKWKSGDVSLAELYGPSTRSLAVGAAQYPNGTAQAQKFFGEKIAESPENIRVSVRKNVSPTENYLATVDDIVSSGQQKASPIYEKAYQQVADIPEGSIPKEITSAISAARRKYPSELDGLPDNSIKVIDYAKKVIDDQIETARRQGQNNFVRSRTQIKNDLLKMVDEASPEYAQARAVSGDYLRVSKAMDDGRNFSKADPEELAVSFKSLTDKEKEAYKIGVGKSIMDKISSMKGEGKNPYSAILGSSDDKARLMKVLNPSEYKSFKQTMDAENRLFKMSNEVLGGSQTSRNIRASEQIAGAGADVAAAIATGSVSSIGRSGVTSFVKKLFDGMDDKVAGKVSEILYETNPEKKLSIFSNIAKSKDLTAQEKEIVKKVYFETHSLISPIAAGASTGGAAGSNLINYKPVEYITLPDGTTVPRITVNPIKKPIEK